MHLSSCPMPPKTGQQGISAASQSTRKTHVDKIVEQVFREEVETSVGAGAGVGAGVGTGIPGTQDRAAFIAQRKMDSLNCYLRTACMRLSDDITMPDAA